MPDPSIRQVFLPSYKVNINVPAGYSDSQISDAIQRNKTQIQCASPVFAQGQQYLQNGLGADDAGSGLQMRGLGITEQQARTQGVGPAVQASLDTSKYSYTDEMALLRHYAAVKAIYSANQHPNGAQIVEQSQSHILPSDSLTAIGDRVTRSVSDVVNTPILNHWLDYGAPGASQQLEQTQGYGAGLARGLLGFSSPISLGNLVLLGPGAAEPIGAKILLGAFGAQAATGAYQRAKSGDVGGAMGELTAFSLPFAGHISGLASDAVNAENYFAAPHEVDENYSFSANQPSQILLHGQDPNVYEADFQPNGLEHLETQHLLMPPNLPAITSLQDADGVGLEPPVNIIRQILAPAVSTAYHLPDEIVSNNDDSPNHNGQALVDTANGLVSNRRIMSAELDSITPVPSVANSVITPAFSSALSPTDGPLDVYDSPRVPNRETQVPVSLWHKQEPFSYPVEPLFSDGGKENSALQTLQRLQGVPNSSDLTTGNLTSRPDAFNQTALYSRGNTAIGEVSSVLGTNWTPTQILKGAQAILQDYNSPSTKFGDVSFPSVDLDKTQTRN